MGSRDPVSVSPLNIFDLEGEADDEHQQGDPMAIDCERLALAEEGGNVKRILNPLLPSEADVEEHWIFIFSVQTIYFSLEDRYVRRLYY